MPVSEATYERLALEDPEGKWELVCGRLRQKPGMTAKHEHTARTLARRLGAQLSETDYDVGQDSPKLRVPSGSYRIPDVCVVPRAFVERHIRESPTDLEVYEQPMPLVVEVWSPSTGDTDVAEKLKEYQQRGDLEVWRIHPYERTLTAWVRQPDGSYAETLYRDGVVRPTHLPGVVIKLSLLFE